MKKKLNNITFGLFNYRGRYWWLNITDIPRVFKRIIFVLKHGYAPQARWETFSWFIDTMKEILEWQRYNRCGDPIVIENYNFDGSTEDKNISAWNNILDTMMDCLDKMDERNQDYVNMDYKEKENKMNAAKEKFFDLFNRYFFNLWD